jgi:hypothetical protein
MDVEKSGNLIEAAVWFVVAALFILKAIRADSRLRLVFLLLAVAFLFFGISDLVESETGAWWRPLWLLALKTICVASFVFGFTAYYRLRRQSASDANGQKSR